MRKNFDKFIIDNVIMERSKLDELFHPVILNEEILKYWSEYYFDEMMEIKCLIQIALPNLKI